MVADDEGGVQLALQQWLVVQVLGLTCGLSNGYTPVKTLLLLHCHLCLTYGLSSRYTPVTSFLLTHATLLSPVVRPTATHLSIHFSLLLVNVHLGLTCGLPISHTLSLHFCNHNVMIFPVVCPTVTHLSFHFSCHTAILVTEPSWSHSHLGHSHTPGTPLLLSHCHLSHSHTPDTSLVVLQSYLGLPEVCPAATDSRTHM